MNEYSKAYYAANRVKWKAKYDALKSDPVAYAEKLKGNRERRKVRDEVAYREYQAKWRSENREYIRLRQACWEYNISLEQAKALRSIRICQGCEREGKLHIDHNHKTGTIRGMLCGSCNRALGLAQDSAEVLRKLAAYLERSEDKESVGKSHV